ncbi:MAG: hypothetical protein WBF32_05805 [Candidatus Aminicenantaceae bacterium]
MLVLSTFLMSGVFCGKRGPIYPPLVKIPQKIEDLEVFQMGNTLVLQWSNPTSYMDGNPIEGDIAVELWLLKVERELAKQQEGLTEENFASKALLHETIKQKDFAKFQDPERGPSGGLIYTYELSSEELSQMVFVFGLRVKDSKDKESGFSSLKPLIPKSVPLPPLDLQAMMRENNVAIEWKPPEKNIDSSTPPSVAGYNVYRESENEEFHRINTTLIEETSFVDRDFVYNMTYRYYVRASATRSSPYTESGNSKAVEMLTEDTLIPIAPTGLVAIAGENFVSLTWDSNKETDLAGYRVWRRSDSVEEFAAVTELIAENVFHDSKVEKNQRYFYAITALDVNGNESQRSEAVSVVLGRERL